MFTQLKKDYYSVNANISLSPVRTSSLFYEGGASVINPGDNNQSLSQIGTPQVPMSVDQVRNTSPGLIVNPEYMMMMPPRYDDIYYPRTDKRMISKKQ